MLMQILTQTPKWVFALFAGLLYLGFKQMLPRHVGQSRATVLPLAMTALSLLGVVSAFGDSPMALLAWLCGSVVAFALGFQIPSAPQVRYDAASRSFALASVLGEAVNAAFALAPLGLDQALGVRLAVGLCLAGIYPLGMKMVIAWSQGAAGATLGLLLPTLWFWPAQTPGAGAWAAVVAMGIVCTGVAYILYFRIIEKAGPSRALSVTFLAPVFALFYGAVLLGEQITPWMVGCGVVIVLGTALSTGLLKARR